MFTPGNPLFQQTLVSFLKGLSAASLNNLGYHYRHIGEIKKGLHYYSEALKMLEDIGYTIGIEFTMINIASLYSMEGEVDKALEFYDRIIELEKEKPNLIVRATVFNNIAKILVLRQQYDTALTYLEKALALYRKIGHFKGIGFALNSIGQIYYTKGDHDKGIKYFLEGKAVREKMRDQDGLSWSYASLSTAYHDKGDLKNAEKYSKMALELAQKIGYPERIDRTARILSDIYVEQTKYKDALRMFRLHVQMKDSMHSISNEKAVLKQRMNYEHEKKVALMNADQASRDELSAAAKHKQQIVIYAFGGGLALVIMIAFLMFRSRRNAKRASAKIAEQKEVVEKQRDILETKNNAILDSINYAKRIQSAILPPTKLIKNYLPNSFILYKPKDIIAGDFYWFHAPAVASNNRIFFSAADCTGHGVPGAMMSVLCSNALSKCVKELNIIEPAKILDECVKILASHFVMSEENVQDGMDLALCRLDLEKRELQYAGAHNPLWIVRSSESLASSVQPVPLKGPQAHKEDGSTFRTGGCRAEETGCWQLLETKADKQPIGAYDLRNPYTNHTIKLNDGDTIYIFTDGFIDQFGGKRGKKHKARPFKEHLVTIQNQTMEQQLQSLDAYFEEWRGKLEQIDDVCVIGVKI